VVSRPISHPYSLLTSIENMFYGLSLKPGVPVPVDTDLGEVLHISQACLNSPSGGGNTYVKIKEGQNTFTICCLKKEHQEHASLDLFVQAVSGASFVAEGPNEVHLLGYWEPNPSLSDEEDDDELGLMDDEAIETSDEEAEMERFSKKLPDIEEVGDDDESDEEEEDDEEDVPPAVVAKPKAGAAGASANKQKPGQKGGDKNTLPQPKAKVGPKATPKAADQKRKATDSPAPEPAAKQAKSGAPAGAAKSEGGEDKFQADLTEYLSKHGRTTMSELGSKVKKPAGMAKKIGVFLKERKDIFKIEGSNVELLK